MSNTSPDAVVRPWKSSPYQDAMPTWTATAAPAAWATSGDWPQMTALRLEGPAVGAAPPTATRSATAPASDGAAAGSAGTEGPGSAATGGADASATGGADSAAVGFESGCGAGGSGSAAT